MDRPDEGLLTPIHPVRVALFAGQGVDEQHTVHLAEERWGLARLGFTFTEISGDALKEGALEGFDVLVVPGGHAAEIIHGWDRRALVHAPPWTPPGRPSGIGATGIQAIRTFVRRGGGFVGLGSGGGVLAAQHAGLIDTPLVAEGIGEGIATLRVVAPNHPVVWGMPNSFPAYYYSEPMWRIWGAPVFEARGAAQAIATYEHPSTWRTQDREVLKRQGAQIAGKAAILAQQVEAGRAVVMGISPNFRATWLSTTPLLANAIWHAAGIRGGVR